MTDAIRISERPLREMHLFAGCGGGILGGMLLRHTCVCAVEIEPYCRRVLLQRQRDGMLPRFPIWDDIRTFDGKPWRGLVEVVCGGFPCQDISVAGNGAGIDGERSGLWGDMARVVREVGPRFVFVENSPALTIRGLGRVLRDLATLGYDAKWGVFSASDIGAFHQRERIWILANAKEKLNSGQSYNGGCCEHNGPKRKFGRGYFCKVRKEGRSRLLAKFSESGLDRVAYDLANQVDRLGAIGNGQVPAVVELAWETLST